MDITDPKIIELKAMVSAAYEEFNLAVQFHEVWKPTAYDRYLHGRMGPSYASQAFLVIRKALRREMVLALVRLWDTHPRALRMTCIRERLREKAVIEALAIDRVKGDHDDVNAMREGLGKRAAEVKTLIEKYMEGGSHNAMLKTLAGLRHEQLAHRQLAPGTVTGVDKMDEKIEEFYRDNVNLIRVLMGLVNATAYDPFEMAKAFERYAGEFWSGARSERTEGHPHFRPPTAGQ